MRSQNQHPINKNRMAPPALLSVFVLVLFLSSILFSPLNVISSQNQSSMSPQSIIPGFVYEESTPLYQEKMEVIAGKDESIIANLVLEGGTIEIPFDLTHSVFASITQIDFIISDQSNFASVWTNPLWKTPDGLVVRIKAKTTSQTGIDSISYFVKTLIFQSYGVNLSIYNLVQVSPTETTISLVADSASIDSLTVFSEIFSPYLGIGYGNMGDIILELLQYSSPTIYAFGYSLHKQRGSVNRIIRSAMVAIENSIELDGDLRTFNVESALGSEIIPDPSAFVSKFSFELPFYANITGVSPNPDNVASNGTGSFEWILKFSLFTKYPVFNSEISYYPSTLDAINYPIVMVTNSYSDQLLENQGILNMTYTFQNVGSSPAYDTTIRFPIPEELEPYIFANITAPVLKEDIKVDEVFSSFIELEIDYIETYNIPILDVNGWYSNTTSLDLARWMDNSSIVIDDYVTLECSQGISSDLYTAVESRIQPILDSYDIVYILSHYSTFEPIIKDALSEAVLEAYNIVFNELYVEQPLFRYNSTDFTLVNSTFGSYLECIIPTINVNETYEKFWTIIDIPTSDDKFGATSVSTEQIGLNEYAVFTTTESDYKAMMLALLAESNTAGRFLSTYDSESDTFVSLGSRFTYTDGSEREYYGLTNGLNFQIGDDEAVLQSSLYSKESVYSVGDEVNFILNITNVGTLDAYDIHVDIVNIKLNYLWSPTDVIVVKSFEIDQIIIGENLTYDFSVTANSYIGLNTYVALISFTSDKDQEPTTVEDPWSGIITQWPFGGEASNLVSSTLTFGILIPPVSLRNLSRPSFPLPEIAVDSSYQLSDDNTSITVEYEITNEGLSPTIVSVYQFLDPSQYSLDSALCSYHHNLVKTELDPIVTTGQTYNKVSFAIVTLNPGDTLIINETFSNLLEEINIPPIIITYLSDYEIMTTDFQPIEEQIENQLPESDTLNLKLAPANITEGSQTTFLWSTFTPIIRINIPISEIHERITLSPLPWIYIVISTGVLAGILVIVIAFSKLRFKNY